MEGCLGARESAVSSSGREASNPLRNGEEMSGKREAVEEWADLEMAEGKKRTLGEQIDLCSQSSECRDQRATASVWASWKRSLRSGVFRSGLEIRAWRVEWDGAGAL